MSRSRSRNKASQRHAQRPQPPKKAWLLFASIGLLVVLGGAAVVAWSAELATRNRQLPQQAVAPYADPTPVDVTTTAQASASQGGSARGDSSPQDIEAEGGVVSVPLTELAGNEARFYTFQGTSKAIPFFIITSSDGVVRAAFDACDVCYQARRGYYQDGDDMVCNNCGSRFPSAQVNEVQGGCNPAPIIREAQGGMIIFQAEDLEAGARFF